MQAPPPAAGVQSDRKRNILVHRRAHRDRWVRGDCLGLLSRRSAISAV